MKFKFTNYLTACSLMGGLLLAPETQAVTYTATRLEPLSNFVGSYALGINNAGLVVSYSSTGGNAASRATIWQAGSAAATGLDGLGGSHSYAWGVNANGQVVGQAELNGDIFMHAALWQAGATTATDLDTIFGGRNYSQASSINNSGLVTGNGSYYQQAVLWQTGATTAIDLNPLPGGARSIAAGVNDSGLVVGQADTGGGYGHAVLWRSGSTAATDLGTLGGYFSGAAGVNANGLVVGQADLPNGSHAALWRPGSTTAIDLGVLSGITNSNATGVNRRPGGWFVRRRLRQRRGARRLMASRLNNGYRPEFQGGAVEWLSHACNRHQ